MINETLQRMNHLNWLKPKMTGIFAMLILYTAVINAQAKPEPVKQKPAVKAMGPATTPPDLREKLVQLALQNPNYEIVDRKVTIAQYGVKKAKGSWLNAVAVQGNLNEFAFKGSSIGANGVPYNPSTFYPKYNIGANIPFDMFSAKKNDVKIAKENVMIAEAEKNLRFREIKRQVLSKYEDYLLVQQNMELQSQLTQDASTAYLAAEKSFQQGTIKPEDYNKSYQGYMNEKSRQLQFQHDFNIIKYELEEMIGISMDDLMKQQ